MQSFPVIPLYWIICTFTLLLYSYFTRKRHLALALKGLPALKHFILALKHITTPTNLLARPGVVIVTPCFTCACTYAVLPYAHVHMLYSCMLTPECISIYTSIYIYTYIYTHIYIHKHIYILYSCFASRSICNCCNPAFLKYLYLCSCFTPASLLLLLLLCVCVCVCV
jgi:hypothetical protein